MCAAHAGKLDTDMLEERRAALLNLAHPDDLHHAEAPASAEPTANRAEALTIRRTQR